MRFLFAFILLYGVSVVGSSFLSPQGETAELALEQAKILLPQQPSETERKAAELLVDYLHRIYDVTIPVCQEPAPGTAPVISVGATVLVPEDMDLGEVGYDIREVNGNLILTGGRRSGPTSAVLALLEEDLGCRWLARDMAPVVPKQESKRLVFVPRSYVPPFEIRDPFFIESFDSQWCAMNRTNPFILGDIPAEFGGRINFHSQYFCHTFKTLFPAKEFGESHPEFFPLIDGKRRIGDDGQLCLSNPALVPLATTKVLAAIEAEPDAELIGISQNDCKNFCQCPACAALQEKEGSPAGPVLAFVNQIADAVRVKYPDKKIVTLAYMESFVPPKNIRPAENVIILLCTDAHTGANPFLFVDESSRFAPAMRGWRELGAVFYIWDYVVDYLHYARPYPNLHVMDHAIDFYLRNGAKGVMTQGDYTVAECAPGGALKAWCVAKKLWNPSLRLPELAREFISLYYGDAAPEMQEFFDLQEREWAVFHANAEEGDVFSFSKDFLPQARSLIAAALVKAEGDAVLIRRIRIEEFSIRYQYAYDGLHSRGELADYLANIDWLEQSMAERQMTSLSELGPVGNLFDQWRAHAQSAAQPAYSENAIRPIPNTTVFSNFPVSTVEEPELPEGSALRQPGGNTDWTIQITVANFSSRLQPGHDYVAWMPVRFEFTEVPEPGTPLFVLGQHNPEKRGNAFIGKMPKVLPDRGYCQMPLGIYRATTSRSSSILFITPYGGAPVKAFYYGALQLIPVDEYRGELPVDLPREKLY